jgi:hypothetical protein
LVAIPTEHVVAIPAPCLDGSPGASCPHTLEPYLQPEKKLFWLIGGGF